MARPRHTVSDVEKSLERLFRLTVSRTMYARQNEAIGTEVTRAGYAVLRAVDDAGALAMSELARQCSMDPAAAGRLIRSLESDGLVSRHTDAEDGRVVTVRLTDRGRRIYRAIVDARTAHLSEVLADWPEADRLELVRLVDRLVEDLRSVPFRASRPTN